MGRGSRQRGGRGRSSRGGGGRGRGSRGGRGGGSRGGRGGSFRGGGGRGQKRRGESDDRRPNKFRRHDETDDEPSDVEPEVVESSESSEEEEKDPFKELLGTMNLDKKPTVVSDEEEDNDEEGERPEGDQSEGEEEDVDSADEEGEEGESDDEEVDDEDSGQEEEEEEEEQTEEVTAEEEQECSAALDPFTIHLYGEFDSNLLDAVSSENPAMETTKLFWTNLGHMQLQMPKVEVDKLESSTKGKLLLADEKVYLKPAQPPQKPSSSQEWSNLFVKQQIQKHLAFANSATSKDGSMSGLQKEVFAVLNNYQDFYLPERTNTNAEELRFVYCLHAVNHVLKTRAKILLHNSRLNKRTEVPDEFRDQGLTRPKVLILLPFKDSAFRTINMIISILLGNEKGTVMNQKRYIEEFTGEQLSLPKINRKPEDYETLFRGNTDDNFRIGMSITKKRLKLYTEFYQSDIIVASPLGLRMIVGAEGDEKRDYDFLAGLELVVMDQAEVCFEQNWDHVLHLWEHLHLQPKEAHSTDYSRLRFSALAGHSRYLSQTAIFSSIQLPDLAALFRKRCRNFAGKVTVANPIKIGSISQVLVHLPQVFQKIEASSAAQSIDKRFEVFTTKIMPQFKDSMMSHTLIYVPSYFDFVRVRNHFKKEDTSFVQICEYSKDGKIARARDLFFHNEAHCLLYSERFHFFRRIRIKGIRHLIFYQPPTFPHFYPELCNFMQDAFQNNKKEGGSSTNMTVTVLYSKYDIQRLAAIVGSDRASKMISSEKSIHMMVTGGD